MSDPEHLLRAAGHLLKILPHQFAHIQAKALTHRMKELIPNNMNLTISDPISAMAVAGCNLLSTPAGQRLMNDVLGLGEGLTREMLMIAADLLRHLHKQVTPPVASAVPPVIPPVTH